MIELTGHKGLVVALAYSPDDRMLASASADGSARLWDLATGKLKATFQSPAARAHCVAFSPDGKVLAVGYGEPVGLVQKWSINPPERRESWAANQRVTRGIAFSPDGKLLASVGDDCYLKLWDDSPFPYQKESFEATSAAVAISADGKSVAAVNSRNGMVRIWPVAGGVDEYRTLKPASAWGYSIVFNPSGDRLAVGLEKCVALWDPADYRPPNIWPAHSGAVLGVAFTPDGQTLLTGGADGLVKLWDPDGRLRHTFDWKIRDVGAVAFSPDGLTAAAGGVETILVWDVDG